MSGDPLITAPEAMAALASGDGQFIDATWTFDGGPQPRTDARIPGAIAFDIDTVKDAASPLPHMLPGPEDFAGHLRRLGIAAHRPIIVYDRIGLFSAPRVWWMLRAFGIDSRVLDGGMPAWLAAGGPTGPQVASGTGKAGLRLRPKPDIVADFAAVNAAIDATSVQIVDVRPAARFSGEAPEPRAGLACGHMPGALNLPFMEVLNADGTMKDAAQLEALFAAHGVSLSRPVITSCGSGVTACIAALALARLGVDAAVYDGSWAEWGSHAGARIVTD